MMNKPALLKKGDTIAVLAPSSGLAKIFPHRLERAIEYLKSSGYKVKLFSSATSSTGWSADSAEVRARDLNEAFADKEVNAIIATIGGLTANQILDKLDYSLIEKNPKIFCGYSDNTVIHSAINKFSNLVTFYGPCLMTQFGEYPKPLEYTETYFQKAVSNDKPIGVVNAANEWTDEILDWSEKLDLTRPRKLVPNSGFEWLRKGNATGKILGGCLTPLIKISGSKYFPDFDGSILLLEIPEGQNPLEGTPLSIVDSYLTSLRLTGAFDKIKGLIFGRPFRYSEEDTLKLKKVILSNTQGFDFPILFNVDVGHSDPLLTIPLGVKVELNSSNNSFEFLESGVI